MPEILPGVFQVEGVDPPGWTTHVYLLRDAPKSYTVVDAGLEGADDAILRYAAGLGIAPKEIRRILITHLHGDHTGGLARLAEKTGARVYAHWTEASFIEHDPVYDGPGSKPPTPVRIDERLRDGDRIDAGGGLIAYHTPGHTPGHTVFYHPERKYLITGDLLAYRGEELVLGPEPYSLHLPTMRLSARRVAQLSIDALLTYHGGPRLENAGAELRRLALPG